MSSYQTNQHQLRIGDTERDAAVTALGEHYAAGRITKDEFDERAAVAHAARTSAELWPLFSDLPQSPPRASRPSTTPARSGHSVHPARRTPTPGRSSWWAGAKTLPIVLILVGLVLLTGMPWFVPLIVAGVLFLKFKHC